ncbi:uncharacterized protein LOC128214443 isoform X2 [Mya arenaria]|uniref:uncharacterized protein LOC128214443 isoform X2 n=1 Tax=Mya arenaria TaxID=6604 RepID=UPI0022E75433|nr:uncharacterized protein LOC128214443 isoform X2 [Mya arenaria]XP_052776875.1 uncharacterized protein LOC128214443 isoform X2 [Mya arenaria]
MSMDFRKTTYKPQRADNRFRTSYSLMSQWMNRKGSAQVYRKEPLPQTFQIAMQGNAAFPPRRNPSFSAGDRYGQMSKSMDQMPPYEGQGQPDPLVYNVTAQNASIDESVPVHLRFNERAGYDDFHKNFQQVSQQFPSASYPEFGPARLRHGRAGGSWRHVKEVLQAGGARIVFVDGVIRWADGVKADEVPAGHLINPRVGEIKSRYMVPSRQQPSASNNPFPDPEDPRMQFQAPVLTRSKTFAG